MFALIVLKCLKGKVYLIYGAFPSSRKVALAIQFGVNLISEDEFAEMLAKVND